MKLVYRTSTYYPVIDMHSYQVYQYHTKYGNLFTQGNSFVKDHFKVTPKELNKFLIDQLQRDQTLLIKPKEVLFMGRSNVGKSSLINAISGIKLGKVSQKSGSTLKLHFHQLPKMNSHIVDAPGYGFAEINPKAVRQLQGMIYNYVKMSSRLCRIYLLVDSEHGIKKNDEYMLKLLESQNINIQIILTKVDKINKLYDRQLYFSRLLKQFKNIHPLVHAVSVKDNFGITDMQQSLVDSLVSFKPRNVCDQEEWLIKLLRARSRPMVLDVNKAVRTDSKLIQQKTNQLTIN